MIQVNLKSLCYRKIYTTGKFQIEAEGSTTDIFEQLAAFDSVFGNNVNKANGGTNSKYAPLEDIVSQTQKTISDNNFSYSWDTISLDGNITVVCKVTHSNGHSETSTMVSKIADGTKVNSEPQKVAITQISRKFSRASDNYYFYRSDFSYIAH